MRDIFCITFLLSLFLIISCVSMDPEKENISLRATVSATRSASTEIAAQAKRLLANKIEPFRLADCINITPTKLEIYIDYISVVNEAAWETEPDQSIAKFIEIPVKEWVDVANAEELTDLVSTSITIDREQFGFYSGISMVLSDSMRVSADIEIEDTLYKISDFMLKNGGDEYRLRYPDSFMISGEPVIDSTDDTLYSAEIPEIRVILDATGLLSIQGVNPENQYYRTWIPSDSTFEVYLSNLIAIPYIGTGTPHVDRFKITWERGWEHYIRLVTVSSAKGKLQIAKARVIYSPNHRIKLFEENPGFRLESINWTHANCMENNDETWRIGNDSIWVSQNPQIPNEKGYVLPETYFPSFKLEDHTGEMVAGDTTIIYNASKL